MHEKLLAVTVSSNTHRRHRLSCRNLEVVSSFLSVSVPIGNRYFAIDRKYWQPSAKYNSFHEFIFEDEATTKKQPTPYQYYVTQWFIFSNRTNSIGTIFPDTRKTSVLMENYFRFQWYKKIAFIEQQLENRCSRMFFESSIHFCNGISSVFITNHEKGFWSKNFSTFAVKQNSWFCQICQSKSYRQTTHLVINDAMRCNVMVAKSYIFGIFILSFYSYIFGYKIWK